MITLRIIGTALAFALAICATLGWPSKKARTGYSVLALLLVFALVSSIAMAQTVTAASPSGTVVMTGSAATITDAAGDVWGINATAPCTATWATAGTVGEATLNGTPLATTCQVIELAYVNGVVWQENSSSQWYSTANEGTSWGAGQTTSPLATTGTTTTTAAPSAPVTATLSWVAPTTNTDGSAITGAISYNIYQGQLGAQTEVATGITILTWTSGSLTAGQQCWAVTAVAEGLESAQSPQACKTVAQAAPNPPTNLTAQ